MHFAANSIFASARSTSSDSGTFVEVTSFSKEAATEAVEKTSGFGAFSVFESATSTFVGRSVSGSFEGASATGALVECSPVIHPTI